MVESNNKIISPKDSRDMIKSFAESSEKGVSVIFGAGASYGYSSDFRVQTPPVVADLFNERNPIVKSVINRNNHVFIKNQSSHFVRRLKDFNNDLEEYLTDLYKKDVANNSFPSLLLYLQDIFHYASKNVDMTSNHYRDLINILADWRGKKTWSLLSFNYDTILEQSFISTPRFIPHKDFVDKSSYNGNYPKVLKMHGSVSFRYIFDQPYSNKNLSAHEIFTNMMDDAGIKEEMLSPGSNIPELTSEFYDGEKYFKRHNFPLMMIPIHGSISPKNSFFKEQIENAKTEISRAGIVISIGYNFGDDVFVDSLKNLNLQNSTLILVGSDGLLAKKSDHISYQNIKEIWPNKNIYIFGESGFGNFTESLYG